MLAKFTMQTYHFGKISWCKHEQNRDAMKSSKTDARWPTFKTTQYEELPWATIVH